MGYLIPKATKKDVKIFGQISLSCVGAIVGAFLVAWMFSGFITNMALKFVYYAVTVAAALWGAIKSRENPAHRNFKTVLLAVFRSRKTFYSV